MVKVSVKGQGIGVDRSAYVRVPSGEGPWPVVMAFHGGKGRDGTNMVGKLKDAEDRGILLVYPNGGETEKGAGWTGPEKEDEADPMRDVRYVHALIDTLAQEYPIDTDRVFAVGMSGGGYMTDLLWCTSSDRIAGFGVVSRAMPRGMAEQCEVKRPRPYVLFLGTADDGLVNEYQMSFPETRAFIQKQLGCAKSPDSRRTLPDKGDALTVEHAHWTCTDNATFDYYEIEGGGHAWPGAGKFKADKTIDVNATEVMLKAFGLI